MNKEINELRVKVNGGYLVASLNPDPSYPGISILFEAENGCLVDIVTAECKDENNNKIMDVYCYEDVYNEDWTRKFSLSNEEMVKVTEDDFEPTIEELEHTVGESINLLGKIEPYEGPYFLM